MIVRVCVHWFCGKKLPTAGYRGGLRQCGGEAGLFGLLHLPSQPRLRGSAVALEVALTALRSGRWALTVQKPFGCYWPLPSGSPRPPSVQPLEANAGALWGGVGTALRPWQQ